MTQRPCLLLSSDEGRAVVVPVDRPLVLGRADDCDVVLRLPGVSRRHARVLTEGGALRVEDLGSTNGVWVNGRRVEAALLEPGDEVRLGTALLRVTAGPVTGGGAVERPPSETVHLTLDPSALADSPAAGAAASTGRIEALFDLLRLSDAACALDDPLEAAAASVARATGASAAYVVLGSGGDEAPFVAWRAHEDAPPRPSRTLLRPVFREGRALLGTVGAEEAAGPSESLAAAAGHDFLAVPLSDGGRVLGALLVLSGRGGPRFRETDLRFAALAARHLATLVRRLRREEERRRTEQALEAATAARGIVARSPAMRDVLERLRRAAAGNTTVLLVGETGTGKEVLSRFLHLESPRAREPFVPINCAAIPPALAESELFGHERGAFTGADRQRPGCFELADGGTLFLDEVGELSPDVQAKLLRVLEEGKVRRVGGRREIPIDVRVVAATHRDLRRAVKEGRFRNDLYYRLAVLEVHVPPLRERREDIEPLAEFLLARWRDEHGGEAIEITPEARAALRAYRWPGNVRELRNVLERAVVLSRSGVVDTEHLDLRPPEVAALHGPLRSLRDVEREHIAAVLKAVGGNRSRAAEILGISRTTLYEKIRRLGLEGGEEP